MSRTQKTQKARKQKKGICKIVEKKKVKGLQVREEGTNKLLGADGYVDDSFINNSDEFTEYVDKSAVSAIDELTFI